MLGRGGGVSGGGWQQWDYWVVLLGAFVAQLAISYSSHHHSREAMGAKSKWNILVTLLNTQLQWARVGGCGTPRV